LTAIISPVALGIEASNALELSVTPFTDIGTARLLTAAKVVVPLVASWDSTLARGLKVPQKGPASAGNLNPIFAPMWRPPAFTPTADAHR
jgi:hypothetical protein